MITRGSLWSKLLISAGFLGTISSCSILLSEMVGDDLRKERFSEEVVKVEKAYEVAQTSAKKYIATGVADRKPGDPYSSDIEPGSLRDVVRKLEVCREEVETLMNKTYETLDEERKPIVADATKDSFEYAGKKVSLRQAYLSCYNLEKKVAAEKIDYCPFMRGHIEAKIIAGVHGGYKATYFEWTGRECFTNVNTWSITKEVPADKVKEIKKVCGSYPASVPEFETEAYGVNGVRKWATIGCQKPKVRASASKFMPAPKRPQQGACAACEGWLSGKKS
jgi:hypothetical protein